MKLKAWILLGISLNFSFSYASAKETTLKVLVQDSDQSIYSEETSGEVLSTFNLLVKGTFFNIGKSYELFPGLIKKWSWNPKDMSYDLTLDENAIYHDGTKPNAEDLEFSLVRGFYSKKRTFYEIYLGNIVGTDKIKEGTRYRPWQIDGIKKIDDRTVKITLTNPNPSFLFSLTRPFLSLTSKRFYNDDLMTYKKQPIGAGKYKFQSEDEFKVTLIAVDNTSKIKKVELFKKNKKTEIYDISFKQDQIFKQKEYYTDEPDSIRTIFFTNQNDLAHDINFRKALFYGVNKVALSKVHVGLAPADSFLTSNFWITQKHENHYNLTRAVYFYNKIEKKLLKKYSIPVFDSSKEFNPDKDKYLRLLKDQLAEIGFDFEFYPTAEKFLSKETAANAPFSVSGRVSDNIDPLLMFGSFRTNSAFKYDNAQNDPIFDKMYIEASKAASTEDRVKTMRKLSNYTIDNYFMIPLTEHKNTYYYNPLTIKSLGDQPMPLTLNFDLIELK